MTMLDDDIKRRLSDYQEPEPEGLWDDILSGLNAANAAEAEAAKTEVPATPQVQPRKPRRVIIYAVSSIAAAAAIVLGVFLMPQEEVIAPTISVVEQPGLLADNELPAEEPEATEEPAPAERQVPVQEETHIVAEDESLRAAEQTQQTIQEMEQAEVIVEEQVEESTLLAEAVKPVEQKPREQKNEEQKPVSIYSDEFKYEPALDEAEDVVEQVRHRRTSIGLMADGVVVPGNSTYGYNQTFNRQSDSYGHATIQMNGMTVNPIDNIKRLNKGQDIHTNTSYTPPVRSGLMFRWTYRNGFGIETGLQYSYMKSVTESGTEANFSRIDTECHFVGIPVNLSYSFWSNRHLNVYINAGILMERMVSGESVTKYFVNHESLGNALYEEPGSSLYQLSANASAGIQYNILPWLALYAEPGATYFINNESLYGDRPWNFNVRLGLRFDISSK